MTKIQQAVKLVTLDKNAIQLDEEALQMILLDPKYADKKVSIISVAGAMREGKSFLLNFFVRYLTWLEAGDSNKDWLSFNDQTERFKSEAGPKSVTKGILIWSKPFLVKNDASEDVVVLLMDTQGLFDFNSSMKEFTAVFALSTLLSSVQIFNIVKMIRTDHLQYLQMFNGYAELVAKENKNAKAFQNLLFLIRDWQWCGDHPYGFIGGEKYLQSLESSQQLFASYEKISCFLMPHPGLVVAQKRESELTLKDIDEDFKTYLKEFVPSFFNPDNLLLKKINDKPVTCRELFEYFKIYVSTFNSADLPPPISMFEATVKANHLAAISSAKALYIQKMEEILYDNTKILNSADFEKEHDRCKKEALQKFQCLPKMSDSAKIDESFKAFEAQILKEYESFVLKNKMKLEEQLPLILKEFRLLKEQMQQGTMQMKQNEQVYNRQQLVLDVVAKALKVSVEVLINHYNYKLTQNLQQENHVFAMRQQERNHIFGMRQQEQMAQLQQNVFWNTKAFELAFTAGTTFAHMVWRYYYG